jgi:MFS family permease
MADTTFSETPKSTPGVDQREPWQINPKFNLKTVVLISFGFFASSAVWSVYDVQMPVTYGYLIPGQYFLIGFLVAMNSIAGFFIQPYTGNLSDRTRSRFGRRMPFIIFGILFSVLLIVILPFTFGSLATIIPVVIIFVIVMAVWRAPVVGLMPDFVKPEDRSKGNAIVNILGGIGTAVVSLVGGMLIKINLFWGFLFVGVCMLASLAIVFFGVKEPDTRKWNFDEVATKKKEQGIIPKLREMAHEEEKSPIWMVVAIFFWFMTYYAFTDLFSLYATDPSILNMSRGTAQELFFLVSVSFIIFALPASILSKKITRKKTIVIGLLISIVTMFVATFIRSRSDTWLLFVVLITFGMGWAFINVNSIAMMWDMARTPKQIGTYTGIYYFGSFLAAILGPMTVGYVMQYITGLIYLFPVGGCFMVIALLVMLKVKRGEPELSAEELEAKRKAIQGSSD